MLIINSNNCYTVDVKSRQELLQTMKHDKALYWKELSGFTTKWDQIFHCFQKKQSGVIIILRNTRLIRSCNRSKFFVCRKNSLLTSFYICMFGHFMTPRVVLFCYKMYAYNVRM